jgi:hypothetical protein
MDLAGLSFEPPYSLVYEKTSAVNSRILEHFFPGKSPGKLSRSAKEKKGGPRPVRWAV